LTAEDISSLFLQFSRLKVMIIGDVMLDTYIEGSIDRISPEAPIPIVLVNQIHHKLGGAANVALNIKSLGAKPYLFSVIGNDEASKTIITLLKNEALHDEHIILSNTRKTTQKNRVVSNNKQLVRYDIEQTDDIDDELSAILLNNITNFIENEQPHVLIIQDYDKGVLHPAFIEKVIQLANENHIPICVDPKKKNFTSYKNVTLFKPNFKELKEGNHVAIDKNNLSSIKHSVQVLKKEMKFQKAIITLSEKGIFYVDDAIDFNDAALERKIIDVSGAGDTVIALLSLGEAINLEPKMMIKIANVAGGLVCQYPKVVAVDKEELMKELNKLLS
jgi:D-glycero-beta-D-manno-heptose-7-phosphate kinase